MYLSNKLLAICCFNKCRLCYFWLLLFCICAIYRVNTWTGPLRTKLTSQNDNRDQRMVSLFLNEPNTLKNTSNSSTTKIWNPLNLQIGLLCSNLPNSSSPTARSWKKIIHKLHKWKLRKQCSYSQLMANFPQWQGFHYVFSRKATGFHLWAGKTILCELLCKRTFLHAKTAGQNRPHSQSNCLVPGH